MSSLIDFIDWSISSHFISKSALWHLVDIKEESSISIPKNQASRFHPNISTSGYDDPEDSMMFPSNSPVSGYDDPDATIQ